MSSEVQQPTGEQTQERGARGGRGFGKRGGRGGRAGGSGGRGGAPPPQRPPGGSSNPLFTANWGTLHILYLVFCIL